MYDKDMLLIGFLIIVVVISLVFYVGLQVEHQVRQQWYVWLKVRNMVSKEEMIKHQKKEISDIENKQKIWGWSLIISLLILMIGGFVIV